MATKRKARKNIHNYWLVVAHTFVFAQNCRLLPTISLSFAMSSVSSAKPKIAIIGGGAAGLAAARIFSRNGYSPTVLEKDVLIGGVWNHKAQSDCHPMYKGLRTNLPKEIMAYREFPFSLVQYTQQPSFVTHREVQRYLSDYAKHFQLERFVQTGACVKQLTVLVDAPISENACVNSAWPKIQLDWSSHDERDHQTDVFDAVCIANGHYAKPVLPDLPGLRDNYKGRTLHSIAYDEPSAFSGQRVLCVGGRASGADLAREIANHAAHVYLSDSVHQGEATTKYNVTVVPKTINVNGNRHVCFQGIDLTVQVDTIIFCTGYEYDFPFINGDSNVKLQTGGRRVAPLYEQLWLAQYPNVAFVGLPHSVVPFPLFELQAEALHQQWCCKWTLPEPEALLEDALTAAGSGGEGKSSGRVPEDTHYVGPAQWDYCRRMAQYANIYDDHMERYISIQKVSS
jgi:hypothetical protein